MKTYNERAKSILQKTRKKEKQRKILKRTTVACVSLALLTAVNVTLFKPYPSEPTSVAKYKNSEYYTVIRTLHDMTAEEAAPKYKNNYEKWSDGIGDFFSGLVGCGGNKAAGGDMMAVPNSGMEYIPDVDYGEEPSGGVADDGNTDYVETTDNQVQGVIEGDLFKRTNSHIFYLDTTYQPFQLRVFSIAGENSREVKTQTLDMQGFKPIDENQPQIYLSSDGKTLTLLMSVYKEGTRYTAAVGYDVSDPENPVEKGRTYLTGDFLSSRMTDGSLLLINSFNVVSKFDFEDKTTYLPHYGAWDNMKPVAGEDIICPENSTVKRYTVVCEIDPVSFAVSDCTALFSHTSEAYVSAENIFVTREYTEREEVGETQYKRVSKTEISCIYYGGEGLEYKGSAKVDGTVKNQYSMDEYNGVLRVATTNAEQTYTKSAYGEFWGGATEQAGSLYCIDLTSLETVASVEKFITGETVESARFDKDKAYICTAVVVTLKDPVFAFDLSDLSNITYVDTGVIEGYSTSLVDFNGYLLGIGYGAGGGLKIEVYVEENGSLESVCSYEVKGQFSEDYKSYYINRDEGFVGLCVFEFNEGSQSYLNTYRLLKFDGYGFREEITQVMVNHGSDPSLVRATKVEEYFYMIGAGKGNFFVGKMSK